MDDASQLSCNTDNIPLYLQNLLDQYDPFLFSHSENVAGYAMQLASCLDLSDMDLDMYYWAGLLHDLGKILVPREILQKPAKLTEDEYNQIKRHPVFGVHVLESIVDAELLDRIKDGILYHHERYDGLGYPNGLKGDAIPLLARVLAIADVYDALTSERPYRQALPVDSAIDYLKENSGIFFDPSLLSLFLATIDHP